MSSLTTASAFSSLVVVVPPERRPNTMSIAIKRSRMPPAMRSAGSEMPNSREHRLAEQREHEQDGRGDQRALERHLAPLGRRVAGVSAANSAATSAGPMVAKYVVNAISAVSSMACAQLSANGHGDSGSHAPSTARRSASCHHQDRQGGTLMPSSACVLRVENAFWRDADEVHAKGSAWHPSHRTARRLFKLHPLRRPA